MTSDYKKYSLEKLQEWVHDAMNSDASPHEIYSAIREAVREDYYYHKDCISRASGLLELLSGHRPVKDKELFEAVIAEKKYYEGYDDFECPLPEQHTGSTVSSLEYIKAKIEANSAWNDGWTQQYYQKIVDEYEAKQPKKWVLPVQECKDSDTDETEYFVSFPDDLLEAANLKEGDQVEWVDQGDGSYLIKKVPMTYNEMVAAGWTMTADGFWIKE
jgi:hypothetical protein